MIGHVYVVDGGNGLYKIGRTAGDPNDRLRALRTGSSTELRLVCSIETRFYEEVELALHRHFRDHRERGEWFRLTSTDIDLIRDCDPQGDERLGIPKLGLLLVGDEPAPPDVRHVVRIYGIRKVVPAGWRQHQ